jgi:hypothetical protein
MFMTFYKTDTSVHRCSTIRIDEFQHRIRLSLTFCGFVLHIFTNLWGHPKNKYRISRPIRRTVIISLEILEKNNNECILILVIYLKKTGLLHTKISNHNIIYSS